MLEPSDLYASVNRMLVGIGQIVTAAVLLALVAVLAANAGNFGARNCAVLALGFTTVGYALQLRPMTPIVSGLVLAFVGCSWVAGGWSVFLLLFVGK